MTDNNLSDSQLKYSYWYVTHKLLLKNIFIAILFLLNFGVWGYVTYSLVFAVGIDLKKDQQLAMDLVYDRYVNIEGIREVTTPKNIIIDTIKTLPSFGDRIDVFVKVKNLNQKWYGTFTYYFKNSENNLTRYKSFIMPGEEKLLVDLDIPTTEISNVIIEDIVWKRQLDYSSVSLERNLFEITDAQFVKQGGEVGLTSDRATFTITNNSNYNFYQPNFFVILGGLANVKGIQKITIDRIVSGQSYPVDVRWFEDISNVSNIEVIPDINFLDPKSFIAL